MSCNDPIESQQPGSDPGVCPVPSTQFGNLTTAATPLVTFNVTPTIKVPVALGEVTVTVNVESNIALATPATEIKRVHKNVFLTQAKLVPIRFSRIDSTDFFRVTRGRVFVEGFIRKNLEYATAACNGPLQDQIANIGFSGSAEVTFPEGAAAPILGVSGNSQASFVDDTGVNARLDKFFFQNLVKYNEQPFGELVAANFFELDFSPTPPTTPEGTFTTLREKIVLELTVKLLQVQQLRLTVGAQGVIPRFDEGTIGGINGCSKA